MARPVRSQHRYVEAAKLQTHIQGTRAGALGIHSHTPRAVLLRSAAHVTQCYYMGIVAIPGVTLSGTVETV